ncbi:Eco57I restriction-modification methylase domain-containing protein [Singulisphaera rosea]
MASLPSNLRRDLERAIIRAREIAVAGSRSALEALTVHEGIRGPHITSEKQIALRNHLRAHAKQIGDRRNSQSGSQAIDRLVQECAYEHWHRMIFGRFLAENNLLVEPDSQVSVTLEDVEELARDEGIDRWELVGRFAQKSLPAIFRTDDPLLQVTLPRETRLQLDALLDEIPSEIFLADDSLGWVYQFWQSAERQRINVGGEKITGETLSAVTQLFTEHYMVLFLLHNTIGAWYAGKLLAERPELGTSASSEASLRDSIRLTEAGGYDFDYLRFVRSPSSEETSGTGESTASWRPMGGAFDGWPKRAAELRLLDPCCGSGHFLIAAFELLVRLRMREESLGVSEAVDAVIRDNLFGLELDARCTQIAAFNVAVSAWKLTGPRPLPTIRNIACTGLSVGVSRDVWMQALESDGTSSLKFYFGQLYDMFSSASTLGSLINPNRFLGSQTLKIADRERLSLSLDGVISRDPTTAPDQHELGVAAQGMTRAAELLADRYDLVLTNVPYLARGKQDDVLRDHIETHYGLGKTDLATAFLIRCLEFCNPSGVVAVVTPQNWLFLKSYEKLREQLLTARELRIVAQLGAGAFESISGEVVNVALSVIVASLPSRDSQISGIDVTHAKQVFEKELGLKAVGKIIRISQEQQFENPDGKIVLSEGSWSSLLSTIATSYQGIKTGDDDRFRRFFWEVERVEERWRLFQSTVRGTTYFGGCEGLIDWSDDGNGLARRQGLKAWGKLGVMVNQMSDLPVALYLGTPFDSNASPLIPKNPKDLPAIYEFCASPGYRQMVRKIDQSLKPTNTSLVQVPFESDRWMGIAQRKYPDGFPEPESDDPTQWLFHGRPNHTLIPGQVALLRLLGYRWPTELDPEMRLSSRSRELVQSCEALLPLADGDGIVCIPSVRGEEPADLRLERLLDSCGLKPACILEDWLRNNCFREHCEVFHNSPFMWHIWDGRKADGFHALVNYHKLASPGGHKLLESLTYSYLGDWINRQESDVKRGESGADGRLAAARTLQERLVLILAGEPPFDIFVRWKPLSEQPIGWNPDINDGVRINIRPFMTGEIAGGRKGAGILRWAPKVSWNKDRGKESKRPREEYPWFWGWDESIDFAGGDIFTGDRWNDCHYSNEFKQNGR